jgi:hypothetical protein
MKQKNGDFSDYYSAKHRTGRAVMYRLVETGADGDPFF